MNKKGLKVLEYNKIIEMLKAQANSQMAKERLAALFYLIFGFFVNGWGKI